MTVLVVGLGTIGLRHARNLKRLNPGIRLTGCRTKSATIDDLGSDAALFDEIDFDLARAVSSAPTLGIIATPASRHLEDAQCLARSGIHVFVEKPISASVSGVQALIDECRERSLRLMVGYNLRFDCDLRAAQSAIEDGRIGRVLTARAEVGQYLPDWRPARDYRQTVSARAASGGGPLLELSHEFDYMRWLAGSVRTVTAKVAQLGHLEMDVPEVASVLIELDSGAVGSIHLDMIDRAPVRRCRVVGTEGTVVWDGLERSAMLYSARSREWAPLLPQDSGRSDTYVREMEHFLSCVAEGLIPQVTGEDGLEALRIAEAADRSAETGRTITL